MLKGTLDDFTLPDIFRLMSLAKKTGRMDVSRGAGSGRVFFNEGDVYYAESSLSREPLGQKLIRARALTESQLNKALDDHAQTGKRVGDILIESGMVSGEQIEAAVAQQIEDAIFDLLRWDLGEFTWDGGAELEVEVPISVSVENLIMEASRRLDELEVIQRKIPGEHAILTMAHAPPEGAAEINITPEEWRALVLVDGSRTVGEIGSLIGKDDFETMKILYGLVSAGLVEVDHEATAAAAEELEAGLAEVEAEAVAEPAPEVVPVEVAAEPEPEVVPVQETAEAEAEVVAEEPLEVTADAEVPVVDALEELPAVAEPEPEPEIEVIAADAGLSDELADLLEDRPPTEPIPSDVAEPEPDIEIVTAAEAPGGEIDIAEETGVVGDEVVAAGEFDMSPDELLASSETPATEEQGEVEVIGATSNGTADLLEPADEMSVPGLGAVPEPPEWPTEEALPTETVSVTDAEDPFLSDLLDQDAATDAPPDLTAPSTGSAEDTVAEPQEEESPTVDRAAVVRELAGLFDEDRPKARATGPQAPPAPGAPEGDQRKRVEDDEQINKGVISRLIKGVKGL
jgi:hypothetical protein